MPSCCAVNVQGGRSILGKQLTRCFARDPHRPDMGDSLPRAATSAASSQVRHMTVGPRDVEATIMASVLGSGRCRALGLSSSTGVI
jgi:hypothetical protein